MIEQLLKPRERHKRLETTQQELVELLRAMVLRSPGITERLHAIFVDERRSYLGDTAIGNGRIGCLSMRMRDLFAAALAMDARGIILAHNHPSGHCRPSVIDIDATQRLQAVAQALDIELLDHLIFTKNAAYSMRAGGNL